MSCCSEDEVSATTGIVWSFGSARIWRSTSMPSTFGNLRSEEHTSEHQSPMNLVCRLLLEKKNINAVNCGTVNVGRDIHPVLGLAYLPGVVSCRYKGTGCRESA